jgi:hypothetical protein
MKHVAEPNFEETAKDDGKYRYFQQNNARTRAVENSLRSLRSSFDEQIINTCSRHIAQLLRMRFLSLEGTEAQKNHKNKPQNL